MRYALESDARFRGFTSEAQSRQAETDLCRPATSQLSVPNLTI